MSVSFGLREPKTAPCWRGRKDTLMKKDNVVSIQGRDEPVTSPRTVLDELVREGARRMLQTALEAEVAEYVGRHGNLVDIKGHRVVVRNGHLPGRDLVTGVGPIRVEQPRVRDKREGHRFSSKILPPFLRRVPSVDALIPVLYLKGISTGDFSEAMESIFSDPTPLGSLQPTLSGSRKDGRRTTTGGPSAV